MYISVPRLALAALLLCVLGGGAVAGLGLGMLLAVMNWPTCFAGLLLGVAVLRIVRGQPQGIRWGDHHVLTGRAGWLVPLMLLVVLSGCREWGVFDSELSVGGWSLGWTTTTTRGEMPERAVPVAEQVTVEAPPGVFADALRESLPDQWLINNHRISAHVVCAYEPPFVWLPLWKSIDLDVELLAHVRIVTPGLAERSLLLKERVTGTIHRFGLVSNRSLRRAVAKAIGTHLGKGIHDGAMREVKRS